MPHFHVDFPAILGEVVDMGALREAIRETAAGIDAVPMAGIRVRAVRMEHVALADGNAKFGLVDLSVRLREGRPDHVKKDPMNRIFATLKDFMAPAMAIRCIARSAEMRDIDADLAPKFGTVRNYLEDTA